MRWVYQSSNYSRGRSTEARRREKLEFALAMLGASLRTGPGWQIPLREVRRLKHETLELTSRCWSKIWLSRRSSGCKNLRLHRRPWNHFGVEWPADRDPGRELRESFEGASARRRSVRR